MINFENAYNKLNEVYEAIGSEIIYLKPYQYNNTSIRVWYMRTGAHDILQISFMRNGEYAVCPFYITENKGIHKIDAYIPGEIYGAISDTFETANGPKTKPFFENLRQRLYASEISDYGHANNDEFSEHINNANCIPNRNVDLPYFSHLTTKSLSDDMVAKIRRMVSYPESYEIIKELRRNGKTLVFTNNFSKRKNLTIAAVTCSES